MNIFSKNLLLAAIASSLLLACSNDDDGATDITALDETQAILASLDSSVDPESSIYQTLDGRALNLEVFAGKKIFVNYWATWCAPCIEEIPSIAGAAEELETEGYVFLLASDESIETISMFLDERGFEGNFIKLNPFFGSYGISAVPSSILVDEQGEVIQSWVGAYEWDSPEMLEQLRTGQQ